MSTDHIPTCCQAHGFEEGGCNGRNCPAGRIDIAAAVRYLRAYFDILFQFGDHAAAKRAGHLAAVTKPQQQEPQPQSGIWFAEPEPEIATTAEAIVNGIAALLAIGFFFGGCVWLIVTLKPLFAVFH